MSNQLRQQATTRNRRPASAAQPSVRALAAWSILGPGAAWVDLLFPTGSLDWIIQGVPPFRIIQTDELPTDFTWDGSQLRLLYDTVPSGSFDMLLPVQCSTFRPPWGGWVDPSMHTWTAEELLGYTAARTSDHNIVCQFGWPVAPLGADSDAGGFPQSSIFSTMPGNYQPQNVVADQDKVLLFFVEDVSGELTIEYVGGAKGVFNYEGKNPVEGATEIT